VVLAAGVGAPWAFWKGYSAIIEKLNGMGARVGVLEQNDAEREGKMQAFEGSLGGLSAAIGTVRERMARVEKGVDSTNDHITEMKLEVLAAIGDLKTSALREEARVRERIVRLETVSDIEKKLGRRIDLDTE
jgi:hypothetical protein